MMDDNGKVFKMSTGCKRLCTAASIIPIILFLNFGASALDYEASGNDIFCLHGGPDGCVYGSSVLPLHLFRYDPKSGKLTDMVKCSAAGGEAYSMATLGGKIYISSYPAARVSVYDPKAPYHYGDQSGDNPRELGRIDDISYRPRSTLAGPLGRIWLASVPDYGRWGGPLSYYDPGTETKKAYYRIVGDGSCYTLAHLEKEKLSEIYFATGHRLRAMGIE